MADTSTIASLATAGGTLILAVATFSSTRSANRAARASEQALKVGLRPVLLNARPHDPPQKIGFVDNHWLMLRDGLAAVQMSGEGNLYLAIPLRNIAAGLAVLHSWHLWPQRAINEPPPPSEQFRRLQRDLYVPAGDVSFWQAAVRDRADPLYEPLRDAIANSRPVSVDVLYGDHDGGQRTITRFSMAPREHADDGEPWLWVCSTSRHWNLDRADPR